MGQENDVVSDLVPIEIGLVYTLALHACVMEMPCNNNIIVIIQQRLGYGQTLRLMVER